jgi:hypothetical protein
MTITLPQDSTIDVIEDPPSGTHRVVLKTHRVVLKTQDGLVPLVEHDRKEHALAHAAVLSEALFWEPEPENPDQGVLFP